jgi:regulator of protease activity HflC (stomatin/prohibitin superfamily)
MEILFILLLIIIALGVAGLRIVKQQTVEIVETLGKYTRVIHPGLNWILYPIQRVAGSVTMKIWSVQHIVEVKTKDNMFVALPVDIMIQAEEIKADKAFYKLQSPAAQIGSWVLNTVRSAAAAMTLDELFTNRTEIAQTVKAHVGATLTEFGYRIENVLVDQPTVSESVQQSFNRVIVAQREKEAAELEGDATKIRMVRQAEAEAEAQQRRAEGMAKSRETLAKGLSESLAMFESIPADESLAMLMQLNKIDAMRDVGKHGNLILMDMGSGDSGTHATAAQMTALLARLNAPTARAKKADDDQEVPQK